MPSEKEVEAFEPFVEEYSKEYSHGQTDYWHVDVMKNGERILDWLAKRGLSHDND